MSRKGERVMSPWFMPISGIASRPVSMPGTQIREVDRMRGSHSFLKDKIIAFLLTVRLAVPQGLGGSASNFSALTSSTVAT